MKKIAIATLVSLVFCIPLFSQTKKEKIEELISINNKSYSKMIDGISSMFDKLPTATSLAKERDNNDSTVKPWVDNTLKPQASQAFEDTANYNKVQRTKAGFKKVMLEFMTDMEKDFVPLYDSAFTEKQIDKMLTYNKSAASKKVVNSSMDLFANGNFLNALSDTSAKSYAFNPKRKGKLDSLMNLMIPKEIYKANTKMMQGMVHNSVTSAIKDTAERKEVTHSLDSIVKKQQSDPVFTKQMDDVKNSIRLRQEVGLDKSLTDSELAYLISYYSDPETQDLKQTETKITTEMMQKIMPKMLAKLGELHKAK